jgi:hypothetical protein
MSEIRSEDDYDRSFPSGVRDDDPRAKALAYALDIRKFEIELYWKRAGYFWTLIAVSFAGFVALKTTKEPTPVGLTFLVSCIGLVLSVGWYLVNRGSKYWQENWERHVDVLETRVIGPLYKTTLAKEEFAWMKFWAAYPYSVSNINQLISLFVVLVWAGLAFISFPQASSLSCVRPLAPWVLAFGTLSFLVLLVVLGRSRPGSKARRINFRVSPLTSTRKRDDAV